MKQTAIKCFVSVIIRRPYVLSSGVKIFHTFDFRKTTHIKHFINIFWCGNCQRILKLLALQFSGEKKIPKQVDTSRNNGYVFKN